MATQAFSRHCILHTSNAPTPAAARAFLRLAPPHAPIPDFLFPRAAATSSGIHSKLHPISSRALPNFRVLQAGAPRRQFITTTGRRETVAIRNPRQDDEGADMSVEITARASNRLKEIMAKDANPNLALRITVESGGCHGFQYLMSLTTLLPTEAAPAATTKEDREEEDTVFKALDGSEAKVVMDGPSLELLKGSKIDYSMELIGSQFKIVDNPLATSSCGCGTSFDIKA